MSSADASEVKVAITHNGGGGGGGGHADDDEVRAIGGARVCGTSVCVSPGSC